MNDRERDPRWARFEQEVLPRVVLPPGIVYAGVLYRGSGLGGVAFESTEAIDGKGKFRFWAPVNLDFALNDNPEVRPQEVEGAKREIRQTAADELREGLVRAMGAAGLRVE